MGKIARRRRWLINPKKKRYSWKCKYCNNVQLLSKFPNNFKIYQFVNQTPPSWQPGSILAHCRLNIAVKWSNYITIIIKQHFEVIASGYLLPIQNSFAKCSFIVILAHFGSFWLFLAPSWLFWLFCSVISVIIVGLQ